MYSFTTLQWNTNDWVAAFTFLAFIVVVCAFHAAHVWGAHASTSQLPKEAQSTRLAMVVVGF
jgi:DNA-binding helix-hairpin-helix protein with protein kinase domain